VSWSCSPLIVRANFTKSVATPNKMGRLLSVVKGDKVILLRTINKKMDETMATATFGKRIKELRTAKKMTLDQLAAATGSSKSYIWELENKDPPRPSAEKLAEIAKVLDVTTDYLIGRDDVTLETAVDTAFFREYSSMPAETREKIRQMAKVLGSKPKE
jgi:transcriptional regulator with XRE-family HTH domain